MENRIYLNDDWQFTPTFSEELLDERAAALQLQTVRLPHTCKELPYHYFSETEYQMLCGYRKVLFVPEAWRGKRLLLTIDGAAHHAKVFLNGQPVGEHFSGYTAFTLDLSEKLRYGQENVLAIGLDSRENLNIPPFGFVVDYMTYGGIYREVYLDIKAPAYIADVFAKPQVCGKVVSQVTLAGELPAGATVRQYIYPEDQPVLLGEAAAADRNLTLTGRVKNVRLWEPDRPVLFRLETQLLSNG